MTVKEFMRKFYMITVDPINPESIKFSTIKRPRLECNDGFSISVQASVYHYCAPRTNLIDKDYKKVELGYPSMADDTIAEYAECPEDLCGTVYGWVPIDIVEKLIEKHGGIKGPCAKSIASMTEHASMCPTIISCSW